MIHLPLKDKLAPPGRLLVDGALRQIRRAIITLDGDVYNQSYYPHDLVTDLLRAFSIHKTHLNPGDQGKCNYCESKGEKMVTLQVEHFRPKAKVDALDNGGIELPGYYWLGLEWTNLLLSCPKCNGKSAKGNRFPIRGNRAKPIQPISSIGRILSIDRTECYADEDPLLAEQAILLNPEIDYPETYLTFNNQAYLSGHGLDPERGEMSKDIYDLNRDILLAERIKVWATFKKKILDFIGGHMINEINDQGLNFFFKNISKDIIQRKSPAEEFTLWGRFINDNLEIFIAEIPDDYQNLFRLAYQEASNEQLAQANALVIQLV